MCAVPEAACNSVRAFTCLHYNTLERGFLVSNEGRFLNKSFIKGDGIIADNDNALIEESGWTIKGGARIGDGGVLLSTIIAPATTVTLLHGSTIGSLNHAISIPVTAVQPGDLIVAAPVASTPLGIIWSACCYTAGAVVISSISTGSWATAAIAGTSWRIGALRF